MNLRHNSNIIYATDSLMSDGEFLYDLWELMEFEEITERSLIFEYCSDEMRDKLEENRDYLLEYSLCLVKPAKQVLDDQK